MIIALQTLIFFRESLIALINRLLSPCYSKLKLQIKGNDSSDDEDSDDYVFSEYDDEKGVTFYPPVYVQRYAAVSDCLMDERWKGKLEKVLSEPTFKITERRAYNSFLNILLYIYIYF